MNRLFVGRAVRRRGDRRLQQSRCSRAGPLPAAPSVTAAPASTDIPTSEDYEQLTVDQINPGNMEQSLVQLEKDIGK